MTRAERIAAIVIDTLLTLGAIVAAVMAARAGEHGLAVLVAALAVALAAFAAEAWAGFDPAEPVTALPEVEVVTLCPTCEGDRNNGHWHPAYVVDCSHCEGTGTVWADQREAFGSPIFFCVLCGEGMRPDYGMRLGITDPGSADCPGGIVLPAFCCEDCLSDPENRAEVLGVIVTEREPYARGSWKG